MGTISSSPVEAGWDQGQLSYRAAQRPSVTLGVTPIFLFLRIPVSWKRVGSTVIIKVASMKGPQELICFQFCTSKLLSTVHEIGGRARSVSTAVSLHLPGSLFDMLFLKTLAKRAKRYVPPQQENCDGATPKIPKAAIYTCCCTPRHFSSLPSLSSFVL